MHTKDESFPKYVIFQTNIETQYGIRVKVLHSDRGGEFLSDNFTQFLECKGTKRKLTVHDTPEHNGVAERVGNDHSQRRDHSSHTNKDKGREGDKRDNRKSS